MKFSTVGYYFQHLAECLHIGTFVATRKADNGDLVFYLAPSGYVPDDMSVF